MKEKRITILMPAKNAAKYVPSTLRSIANQSCKNLIRLSVVYAESFDNTLHLIEENCRELGLDCEIIEETRNIYESVCNAILGIQTDYFGVMCFSDGYLWSSYIESAVLRLDVNSFASYVHSDLHTVSSNGNLVTALAVRNFLRPESGSAFTANVCLLDDGINELTFIARSAAAKQLLQIAKNNSRLWTSPYGALFTMYLVFGCTGEFIHKYSVFGRHHVDSRNNNQEICRHDTKWTYVYNRARSDVLLKVKEGQLKWRDGNLEQLSNESNERYNIEFLDQCSYITALLNSSHSNIICT